MLAIVIPVYNEGENIKVVLGEIHEKVKTPYEIYLVYDFEGDNTIPAVKDLAATHLEVSIHLVRSEGRGPAIAIKSGFSAVARTAVDACAVVMGDCSDRIEIVDQMYALIAQGYDVVCASRYIRGGEQIGGPRIKKFLSSLAGRSLHFLTRIPTHDITNSFRMYSPRVVKNIPIESTKGFEVTLELTVKSAVAGYRITEIPTVWKNRTKGKSNFKVMKLLPSYLYWYLWFIVQKIKRLIL